jgi:hypothetical protein
MFKMEEDDSEEKLTLTKNVFKVTLEGHKISIPIYGTEEDLDTLSRFITWLVNKAGGRTTR